MPELAPEHYERLFPFHIEVDAGLRIVKTGRALRRLLREDATGRSFTEIIAVERPALQDPDLVAMLARQDSVFLLHVRGRELRLRGEWVPFGTGALFVGTPWLTELAQVQRSGLTLRDFALHDPTGELLVVMKTMDTSIHDARSLAHKLRLQAQQLAAARDAALAAGAELHAVNDALEERVRQRTAALEAQNDRLSEALATLQRTQEQLIQAEKMASLGLLVAGIAHELKNPLNFVNNFAELSLDFNDEIQALLPAIADTEAGRAISELVPDLAENLRRIREHGRRADAIINGMLMHARERPGELSVADINDLVRTHVILAYQGFRANDRAFRAEIVEDLGAGLDQVPVAYQELSRVVLNLVSNACYALRERAHQAGPGYEPLLAITTRAVDGAAMIRVRDNGTGVPVEIVRRIFDPFFTTKPPGEGTGLGLSMSYDIVVKQLGGRIEVATTPGEGSEFTVTLPLARTGDTPAGPTTGER